VRKVAATPVLLTSPATADREANERHARKKRREAKVVGRLRLALAVQHVIPRSDTYLASLRLVWFEQKTFRGYEIEMFWALLTTIGSLNSFLQGWAIQRLCGGA